MRHPNGRRLRGLTVRQYYQGQAVAGLCANIPPSYWEDIEEGRFVPHNITGAADAIAEAMLQNDFDRDGDRYTAWKERQNAT